MALYNNLYWLLSYIRDNFVSMDDAGIGNDEDLRCPSRIIRQMGTNISIFYYFVEHLNIIKLKSKYCSENCFSSKLSI